MAFRLLFWRRPHHESAGRHLRATALLVPDSTGALAAPQPPAVSVGEHSVGEPHADLDATAPVPVVGDPVVTPVGTTGDETPSEPPQAPELPVVAPVLVPATAPPAVAGVALGFADGASVELHPDDPRVTSFRAAAAALLDAHEA